MSATQLPLNWQPSPRPVPLVSLAPEDLEANARQRAAILARLKTGPATGPELLWIAHRYGARLFELKQAGWRWSKYRIAGSRVWVYWLEYAADNP